MTRPSCVPSSALLPRRGLPLSGDPGDLHLGVALAVAHPSPVAGLVLVVDDVDLGPGYLAHDLRGDLVVAELSWVADDLAVIDDEHGRQRDAGPDLTGQRVDGQDVVHGRLFLPATAAHDRVHRRTLSLLVRAHRAVPATADQARSGARQLCTGHPGKPSPGSVLCAGSLGYQTPAAVEASGAACPPAAAAMSGGPGSRTAARRRRRPPNGWAVAASAPAPLPAASLAPAGPVAAGASAVPVAPVPASVVPALAPAAGAVLASAAGAVLAAGLSAAWLSLSALPWRCRLPSLPCLPSLAAPPSCRPRWLGWSTPSSAISRPRPLQHSQVSENASSRPEPTRLRVICTSPSEVTSATWCLVRSLARHSSSRRSTSSRLLSSTMSMKSITMIPPTSRNRSCRTISSAASRLLRVTVSSRLPPWPVNLPVFTSTTVIASVLSMTREPPLGSQTLRSSALTRCSSMRYCANTSASVCQCSSRSARCGATYRTYSSTRSQPSS